MKPKVTPPSAEERERLDSVSATGRPSRSTFTADELKRLDRLAPAKGRPPERKPGA